MLERARRRVARCHAAAPASPVVASHAGRAAAVGSGRVACLTAGRDACAVHPGGNGASRGAGVGGGYARSWQRRQARPAARQPAAGHVACPALSRRLVRAAERAEMRRVDRVGVRACSNAIGSASTRSTPRTRLARAVHGRNGRAARPPCCDDLKARAPGPRARVARRHLVLERRVAQRVDEADGRSADTPLELPAEAAQRVHARTRVVARVVHHVDVVKVDGHGVRARELDEQIGGGPAGRARRTRAGACAE
mmetsp:Transcript_11158/g.35206  ORF Transcript_11158/g.35206 Transcript_11158/m.35206 type:complete len:253 (+) Transcript_11158:341-1099(+)